MNTQENNSTRCYRLGLELAKLLHQVPNKRPSSKRLLREITSNICEARRLGVTIDPDEVLRSPATSASLR